MRDLATFAPRWSFRRRTTSALDARAPAPPSPVLLDWDPGYSLYTDRQHAATYAQSGSGSITRTLQANGRYAGVFPGTAGLVATSSPFAALSDLTGGVSIYVVADRTDAGTGSQGVFSLDESANATAQRQCLGPYWIGSTDALVAYAGDDAAVNFNSLGTGSLSRNAVLVHSMHATLTAVEGRVDGVGTSPSAAVDHDPSGLDRAVIGATGIFGGAGVVGSYFTGSIYRVIVCEGAYDAAMLAYLQGLYVTASASAYDGPEPENLALWWSATSPTESLDDSATAFTVAGTPTISTLRGRSCMVCSTTSDGYTATSPWGTLADGTYTLVTLWEGPTGVAAESGAATANLQNAGNTNYLRTAQNRNALTTLAQSKGTIARSDFLTSPNWALDTVYTTCATLRISGANWEIECGLDETLTGSPYLSTSGPPTDLAEMSVPSPGLSDSADGYRIWDVFLFESEIPVGFDAWAKALLS